MKCRPQKSQKMLDSKSMPSVDQWIQGIKFSGSGLQIIHTGTFLVQFDLYFYFSKLIRVTVTAVRFNFLKAIRCAAPLKENMKKLLSSFKDAFLWSFSGKNPTYFFMFQI